MTPNLHRALGPLLALGLWGMMSVAGCDGPVTWTAAVTVWVAYWWVTEPINIGATSLLPFAIFPLVGVLTPADVAAAYGNPLILLMLGGFLLSAAMEQSGVHRRIALWMVNWVGGNSGRRLVFGFMIASAVLSMWISNSATTLMLLPIVMAVVGQINDRKVTVALVLGIAYAASIGGIGTPIGTPPNLVFMKIYHETTGVEPTFVQWMGWALPVTLIMLPLTGWWLTRGLSKDLKIKLPEVGEWRSEEKRALTIFIITATFWITRKQPWGGWSGWLTMETANDASVALLGAIAMFVWPRGGGQEGTLLHWDNARKIPWGILILFAGGVCLASAFQSSGLSTLLGNSIGGLRTLPVLVLVLVICLSVTFLTELTSNTATATLLMPILAAIANANEIEPALLMVPATMSASFAFMLPVATAPNAIVFGSGELTINRMVRAGIVLNLMGVVVVAGVCCWLL